MSRACAPPVFPGSRATWFLPLLILSAGFWVYYNSLTGAFVLDDWGVVVENPRIRQLWPPWEFVKQTNRPLTDLTLAVNYALGALRPFGYHLLNMVIHLLAGLFLFGVIRRTLQAPVLRERYGQEAPGLACAAAVLWTVHPLQTESVSYVAQRSESLMGLFYLLTLYGSVRSVERPKSLWWPAVSIGSCALGMASKPIMVTAPALVLLYDWTFLNSPAVLKGRRWFYSSLLATGAILALMLAGSQGTNTTAGFGLVGISPLAYLATQPGVILHYLRLVFWPSPLILDYGWPVAKTMGAVFPAASIFLLLGLLILWAWGRARPAAFLGTAFFLSLAPSSSVIPLQDPAAEHRMYLPLAAVVTLVVFVGWEGLKRVISSPALRRRIAGVLAVFLTITLGCITIRRNRDYQSEIGIWRGTVAQRPQNIRALVNLGEVLGSSGQYEEAINVLKRALQSDPGSPDAHRSFGKIFLDQGRLDEAEDHLTQSLRIDPQDEKAHSFIGQVYLARGQLAEAKSHFDEALRLNPNLAEAHNNLGVVLASQNRFDEAISHFQKAVQVQPSLGAYYNLGLVSARQGRWSEAANYFKEALQWDPHSGDVHRNLGKALVQLGQRDEAVKHFEEADRLKPE